MESRAHDELTRLTDQLESTLERIKELTGGQVDAVVSSTSATFLLPEAQVHLQAEEAASRLFAARLSAILDAIPAHIAIVDSGGLIQFVNEGWRRFGRENGLRDADDSVGTSYFEVCEATTGADGECAEAVSEGIRAVLSGSRQLYTIEYPCHSATEQRWFQLIVAPFSDGGTKGALVMHINVSEKFAMRLQVAQSEARYRMIAQATSDVAWDWDIESDSVWVSESISKVCGYEFGGAGRRHAEWTAHFHPADRQRVAAGLRKAIEEQQAHWRDEYRLVRSDGTYLDVEDRAMLVFDRHGRCERAVGGITDISGKKRAQTALAEQAALLDAAQEAILLRDMEHRILFWNRGAERMYGHTAEEAEGRFAAELLQCDPAELERATAELLEREQWQGQFQHVRRNGERITVEARWTLLRDAEGNPAKILAINTDVSERVALEEHLRQAQRLEAVGQLTGGLAHDFNNLLTVILGNSEMLASELSEQPALRAQAEMIQSAAESGAQLTQRLLAFARRQPLAPKVVNLNRLLTGMAGMLRRTMPESIRLDIAHDEQLGETRIDPTLFESAILNLSINARDAMPGGGRLHIETASVYLGSEHTERHPEVAPGPYAMAAITDTGAGMPPEVLERAIEPFFTTKEMGRGTGLGLSMVYGFVKQSRGHIEISSAPGVGTSIRLYFPLALGEAEEAAGPRPTAARGREQHVLIVEDEGLVRDLVETLIESLGYRVRSATNAREAIALLETGEPVDLLFTDVVMPHGVSGVQLAEAARRIRPGIRVVFTSGYSEHSLEGERLLSKPYTRNDLARTLAEAFSEENGGTGPKG